MATKRPELTREQWLARCKTVFDKGLVTQQSLYLLSTWTDMVLRFEGGHLTDWVEHLEDEALRTNNFSVNKTLANDETGYKLIDMASIFIHPCQECAEDISRWHTRSAMCPHLWYLSEDEKRQVREARKEGN